jgi:hypothetical protein
VVGVSVIPQPNEIARGSAGDCCILCGKVGIDLPLEHGCKPNVTAQEVYGDGERWDWEAAWTRRDNQRVAPQPQPTAIPTTAALAGILRKVATTPEGQRNTVLHWAACRLWENNYPPEAFDALAEASRYAGTPHSEFLDTVRSARNTVGRAA